MVQSRNADFDSDDMNAYSDEKIAMYLKSLREKSLEELLIAQIKIAEEYAKATETYEAQRTSIRWAKRRYWLFIFVGVFREIWRVLVQGKETKLSQLRQKKEDVKVTYREQDEAVHAQLSLAQDSIDTIKMHADEINQRTKELADLKAVIEHVDAQYHRLEAGDPHDREEIAQQLTHHIEQRDVLNSYIFELNKKIENLVNGLSGLLDHYIPDPIPKDFLSPQREANQEKLATLKARCIELTHPIVSKLLAFLSHQTEVSLQALQAELAKSRDLFHDRVLGDIVWEANAIYPAIFIQNNREQALFDFLALKEEALTALQDVIEDTDGQLQRQNNPAVRKTLDKLVGERDKLTTEISHLLMLHRDVMTGDHAELLERIHALARQHSENAKICDLKRACDRLSHPVSKALHYFLVYRTDVSLQALKTAMDADLTYLESRELVQLVEEVGKVDARILDGWVKEMELPSIKDIQQHYFHSISNSLEELNAQHDSLTDQRVELNNELRRIETAMIPFKSRFTQISGTSYGGYVSREIRKKIEANGMLPEYDDMREVLGKYAVDIKDIQKELAELNHKIQTVEEAQAHCVVEPVLFTPEVLQTLIEKCKQVTRLGRAHPVTTALGSFLAYPTPSLLSKLKLAMQENPDYKKNSKIMSLMNEAHHYFPYINREEEALLQQGLFKFVREHYSDMRPNGVNETKFRSK
ncbi:MAG: hypothetical protein NTU48_03285 [Legionellales bacterium]|nr:hypothetical protein [Legionellales bacterium]